MPRILNENSTHKIMYNQSILNTKQEENFLEDELPILHQKFHGNKNIFNDKESKCLLFGLTIIGFSLEILGTAFVVGKDSVPNYEKTVTAVGATSIAGGLFTHLLLLSFLFYKYSLCEKAKLNFLFFKQRIGYARLETTSSKIFEMPVVESDESDLSKAENTAVLEQQQEQKDTISRNDIMEP